MNLDCYEPKDLLGKSVYDSKGRKIGEVERSVFLKDGKGALILKGIKEIVLMENVESVADIILTTTEAKSPRIQEEKTQPKTIELPPTPPKMEQPEKAPEPPAKIVPTPSSSTVQTLAPDIQRSDFRTPTPSPSKAVSSEVVIGHLCPRCRYGNKTSAKFCVKCGQKLVLP